MHYCPTCLEEYEDSVTICDECKQALVPEDKLADRPGFRRLREDDDPRTFVVVGPAEDVYEADAFTAAIDEAGIPVLARMRHGGSVDALTETSNRRWWEILVPADQREKAAEVMAKRRDELVENEADAEKAAEEEELESENPGKP
jgi:hypothetical protein